MKEGGIMGRLYDELAASKAAGMELHTEDLTRDRLRRLWWDETESDARIAELYGTPVGAITRLRSNWGIMQKQLALESALTDSGMNADSLAHLRDPDKLPAIAKAATHFVFRNGPVENMHAAGQLSQEDMMVLNKFCANRLAYLFQLVLQERWTELYSLILSIDSLYGHGWDDPQPDDGEWRETLLRLASGER